MSRSILFAVPTLAAVASLAVAQDDRLSATWSVRPGFGIRFDAGAPFRLDLRNQLQVHWTYANNEDLADTNNFTIRRLRTMFVGNVFSNHLLYMLLFEGADQGAAGDGNVKMAWAQWNFVDDGDHRIGLRVGQSKTMFGFEAAQASAGLWFVERSVASRAFADSFSRGAWLTGASLSHTDPSRPALRWMLGAMNTDVAAGLGAGYVDRGEESNNSDNEPSYVVSFNFDPLGNYFGAAQATDTARQGDWRTEDHGLRGTVGAGFGLGNGRTAQDFDPSPAIVENRDIESTSINVNTEWTVARFNFLGEYFQRTDDQQGAAPETERANGFNVAAGYLLQKTGDSSIQWGLGLRAARVATDAGDDATVDFLTGAQGIGAAAGNVTELSAVLNAFYHGHQCKTQFEWTLQEVDPDGPARTHRTNHIFRIGFQIEI